MIHYKEFKSLDELNKFNDENDVRIISITQEIHHSTGETGSYPPKYISVTEVCLKVWYEGGWKKSQYGSSDA